MQTVRAITKKQDCANCDWEYKCCSFEKADKKFAPIFTGKEIGRLRKRHKVNIKKYFKNYRGSRNIFQAKLIKSRKWNYLVCPFLNEKTNLCKIYNCCPLDCKMWPFFISRSKDKKKVNLVCFDSGYCPSMMKISKKEFMDYFFYLLKFITSKTFLKFLRENPEYVWDYDKNTFVVKDITKLLKKRDKNKKKINKK